MIETNLVKDLSLFVGDVLKELRLPTKTRGVFSAPKVFNGYLPPKRSVPDDEFPFVVVRADSGRSERGQTTVEVSLVIGCYTAETDGYQYCIEIMQRLRTALCELENQTLGQKYQLEFPITWSNVPEQPYPQWQIDMTTTWTFNTPQLPYF